MIDILPLLDWHHFVYFAIPAVLLLIVSALFALYQRRVWAICIAIAAACVLMFFIGGMWHSLERPPLRTMGETRLWYSFFVIIAGLIIYIRWKYRWILSFATVLSTVFMIINIAKPDIHNKTLMPALESPFFVPHVISYIFAYAMLGAALLVGGYFLFCKRKHKEVNAKVMMHTTDNLVYTGFAFLMTGLLFRRYLGQTCMGHLLELGSERNMGCNHRIQLLALHPSPAPSSSGFCPFFGIANRQFPFPANLLVWGQLPSIR